MVFIVSGRLKFIFLRLKADLDCRTFGNMPLHWFRTWEFCSFLNMFIVRRLVFLDGNRPRFASEEDLCGFFMVSGHLLDSLDSDETFPFPFGLKLTRIPPCSFSFCSSLTTLCIPATMIAAIIKLHFGQVKSTAAEGTD
jgi:hypothetical protein